MWCFYIGICVGKTPLLILRSVGVLSSVFSVVLMSDVSSATLAANGKVLCEGGVSGNMQLHFCTSVDLYL
jgi:hypothetical protein